MSVISRLKDYWQVATAVAVIIVFFFTYSASSEKEIYSQIKDVSASVIELRSSTDNNTSADRERIARLEEAFATFKETSKDTKEILNILRFSKNVVEK